MFDLFTTDTDTLEAPAFIGRCSRGHVTTAPATEYRAGWIPCPCGAHAMARSLNATNHNGTRCSARCTGATGPDCECECVGRNHGRDNMFHA